MGTKALRSLVRDEFYWVASGAASATLRVLPRYLPWLRHDALHPSAPDTTRVARLNQCFPRFGTRYRAITAIALLCSGCATFRSYDRELSATLNQTSSGNIEGAIHTLDANNRGANKDLLYYFELGELRRLQDQYRDSQQSWMSAD